MIPRAWLIVPVAYYGGGFTLHSVSLNRAHVGAEAIEQAAQQATIKVDQPFSFLTTSSGGFELLKHYRVDRTFVNAGGGRAQPNMLLAARRATTSSEFERTPSEIERPSRRTNPLCRIRFR